MDPTYPLLPIIHAICFFLVGIPLFTNLIYSWNTGVCMYGIWVALQSLATSVNTIVWSNNTNNVAPVWCDISTHYEVAAGVGIPACSLIITRRLFLITRLREPVTSRRDKRTEILFDLSICLGLPLVVTGIVYVVQLTRYSIFEEIGCENDFIPSGLTLLITAAWSVLLPAISVLFYCPRIICVYVQHRKEVHKYLSNSTTKSRSNYFRVLALGLMDVVLTLPISILGICVDAVQQPINFWPGWAVGHADWAMIPQITSSEWQASLWVNFTIRWDEWINVAFAVLFFLLFGLTGEARASYKRVFWLVAKHFGFKCPVVQKGDLSEMAFGSVQINPIATDFETHVVLHEGSTSPSESHGSLQHVSNAAVNRQKAEKLEV